MLDTLARYEDTDTLPRPPLALSTKVYKQLVTGNMLSNHTLQGARRVADTVMPQVWSLLSVLVSMAAVPILTPLRGLYMNGPTLGGYGFWGGAAHPDICAQLTSMSATTWNANVAQLQTCHDLIERKFWSFAWTVFTAVYLWALYSVASCTWYRYWVLRPAMAELRLALARDPSVRHAGRSTQQLALSQAVRRLPVGASHRHAGSTRQLAVGASHRHAGSTRQLAVGASRRPTGSGARQYRAAPCTPADNEFRRRLLWRTPTPPQAEKLFWAGERGRGVEFTPN
jgi:hypothetical protein